MFMFRLIVYFYDLRHEKVPTTLAQSVSYFFMLPNACFPLFPVIDFKTYRRSHYSSDAHLTYQKGRRLDRSRHRASPSVPLHLLPRDPGAFGSQRSGAAVSVSGCEFLLYLRVSGLFHLVVGMLHLFGFELPETHKRYLLAASFTDFWRRINIYWKDFMQKIFYFPAVFALKRLGTNNAIIIATLYVFMLTWLLHSYQWFWLRGSWLLAWHDMLFWAVLGVLVVVNSLYEIKYGRKRSLGKVAWSWQSNALTVAKTYGTFWFICILWSFWTSESITDWLALWPALNGPYTLDALLFPLLTLLVIALGSISRRSRQARRDGETSTRRMGPPTQSHGRLLAGARPGLDRSATYPGRQRIRDPGALAALGASEPPRQRQARTGLLRRPALGRPVQFAVVGGLLQETGELAGGRECRAQAFRWRLRSDRPDSVLRFDDQVRHHHDQPLGNARPGLRAGIGRQTRCGRRCWGRRRSWAGASATARPSRRCWRIA
jgi:hypothetical protein